MSSKFDRNLPVDPHGQVMAHAGKYAKGAVLAVFHQIGGVNAMAEWAEDNKTDFYTKLFPKVIDREPPQQAQSSVEDMLAELDREMIDVTPEPDPAPTDDEIADAIDGSPWPDAEHVEMDGDDDG